MIRDVDLVSYLPPFMAEFREISAALETENPEFVLVWEASERVLKNEFIETADEYGISRFERILNILPSAEDTLESRRARVRLRWLNNIPYTLEAFISKLISLCGEYNFTIEIRYRNYYVEIHTHLEQFGEVDELDHIINEMMPCNMYVNSQNEINCGASGFVPVTGGICLAESFSFSSGTTGKEQ